MVKPAQSKPTAAHDRGLFQVSAGFWLSFTLAALGFGVTGHNVLCHFLFAAAWPCGAVSCWILCSSLEPKGKRRLVAVISILGLAGLLFAADFFTSKLSRGHMHILAVDQLSAAVGEPVKARVLFQNDGDKPIGKYQNCRVISVWPYLNDVEEQTRIETAPFAVVKKSGTCGEPVTNQIPAHSIEMESDFVGNATLTPEILDEVSRGNFAIYIAGTLE